jgi:hypothetical protein
MDLFEETNFPATKASPGCYTTILDTSISSLLLFYLKMLVCLALLNEKILKMFNKV